MRKFAKAVWVAEDVHAWRKDEGLEPWTDEEAEEWLEANQDHIRDRMIEAGWGYFAWEMQV